jgi:recombination protein RecT
MSTQLANQDLGKIKALIQGDQFKEQLQAALPRHLSPDRFARIAITAITRTPKLAECTQTSLFRCLLDLSAAGLEPDGRRAHLIPYGKEATLIIDYKGLVELIRRSGDVTSIRAETVCENDRFEWVNGEITHEVNWRKARGDVQAVYAEARMKSGEVQTATMTFEEVEGIRKRSKAGNGGPWKTDWGEMAKKTVVRRLSKMLPLAYEVADVIDKVDRPVDFDMPSELTKGRAAEVFAKEEPKPAEKVEDEPVRLADKLADEMMDRGISESQVKKQAVEEGYLAEDFEGSVLKAKPEQIEGLLAMLKGGAK